MNRDSVNIWTHERMDPWYTYCTLIRRGPSNALGIGSALNDALHQMVMRGEWENQAEAREYVLCVNENKSRTVLCGVEDAHS